MRLTLILLILGMMQVNATTYGQELTLSQKDISLKQIFKAIKKQSGYDVLWQQGQLDANRRINASFNKSSLNQVMAVCLQGQNLSYVIDENSIIVRRDTHVPSNSIKITQDSILYSGRVLDENNKPMAGATVRVKYGTRGFLTNTNGEFRIFAPTGQSVLQITYVGYAVKEIPVNGSGSRRLSIQILPATGTLSEIQVVSDGYQDIAKERATGSFEVVTAKQLEHSTDPNLLKRLEGITTSINFNNNSVYKPTLTGTAVGLTTRNRSPLADLTIRGKNTLSESPLPFNNNGFPLLVIDGIASAYGIDQLDPENIESVTILKDAASASIWGARAANGVLVVKTKRGNYLQSPNISFINNYSITEKPDLFYRRKMSVSDYIDAERLRFIRAGSSFSEPTVNDSQFIQSPVAEILNDWINKKTITEEQANSQLDALRSNDVRNDLKKYILRNAFNQNYSLSINGGTKSMAYLISAAYSDSKNNTEGSGSDRINLTYNGSLKPFRKLELTWSANYIQQHEDYQPSFTSTGTDFNQFSPYTQLADINGNPLEVFKYRPSFIQLLKSTYGDRILDMTYKPLEEMKLGTQITKIQGINLALNSSYKINTSLSLNLAYSYNRQLSDEEIYVKKESYYIRELTNRFTDPTTLTKSLPYGDYLSPSRTTQTGQTLRGQVNYNHTWNNVHALNAIAGIDISQYYSYQKTDTYLGYNSETLMFNNNLNFQSNYNFLYNYGGQGASQLFAQVPINQSMSDYRNRALSTYSNAAYTFKNRYTVSASIRRDGSNIYGASENRAGKPFYSTGVSWNIANEPFYKVDFLPKMQIRATFGYNGNSNPIISPRPRIVYAPFLSTNGLNFAGTPGDEATNTKLRPEKTGVLNLGLDFAIKGQRLSGSFEYYVKNTKDLISRNVLDPTTGFSTLNFNTGDLHSYGADVILNSQNLKLGKFSWNSNFLFSSNRVIISKLYVPGNKSASGLVNGLDYTEGYDLNRLFAYVWAGLDPQTGDPRFLFNGHPITIGDDFQGSVNADLIQNAAVSTAKYMGSAVPVYFGSFRNSFSYGSLVISANILYKLKYYGRRPEADLAYYSRLYLTIPQLLGGEFSQRWKVPGDEKYTNVPSLTYPGNQIKDYMYTYSDINVFKADHIRLQEINISWGLKQPGLGIANARIYANITNLGILWRANKLGIDPDINDVPNPKTLSFGFSANF